MLRGVRRRWGAGRLQLGLVLVVGYALVALLGRLIAPLDPEEQDLFGILSGPSAEHFLGTDHIGRDQFSRILAGTRDTMTIALLSVAIAVVLGTALGLTAGFFRGRVEAAVMGFVDLLLTIPELILAIAIASAMGAGVYGIVAAIAASFTPRVARLVRGRALEIRVESYIDAAVAIGMRRARIILRHMLPNALTVIVIEASLLAGQAVLVIAALGFLGLGVPPPAPEWGTMLGQGREYIEVAPHLVFAPGIAISLLIFGFNMLGDGLRDRFDPRNAA